MWISQTRLAVFVAVSGLLSQLLAAQGSNGGFPLPEPLYQVRLERSVPVPVSDGVRLSTDLYFPEGAPQPFPVILIRTPYDKNGFRTSNPAARIFAGQGYVAAVQDVRGRFESAGEYLVSAYDRRDGSDTVDWLARQPWSTGKIGTYGCSYLGENQMQLAAERNPHHAAALPQAGGGSRRFFGIYLDGAFELSSAVGWFSRAGSKYYLAPPAGASAEFWARWGDYFHPAPQLPEIDYRRVFRSLPLLDMMKEAGGLVTDWEGFVSHDPGDPWWKQFGYIDDTDRFDVPALHVNGWYDLGVADTLALFGLLSRNAVTDRGRDHQFVLISPATHCRSETTSRQTLIGARPLGDARRDYYSFYLRWFDYWLKGIENGVTSEPKVQIFVMGKNEWRGENEWPLARTRFTPYYLHSQGRANSRFGDGVLSLEKPETEPADRFVYDPAFPVPSVGGPICCNPDTAEGAFDQSSLETRQDVLVYTTPVLTSGLEVTGPMQLVLYVSSSARDTDFTAKLVDVYPDGNAYNVQEGILRLRYREGYQKKLWMDPAEIYKVTIDLQATSNHFGPGHRIRVEVSSSNFPRFDRNLNTGGDIYSETECQIARNTVHHSARYPSHLLLPVIP